MKMKTWHIQLKPWTTTGWSANISGAMAGTVKILPSTSNTEAMVMGLARRIAAIEVYEEALRTILKDDDLPESARDIAFEALRAGGF